MSLEKHTKTGKILLIENVGPEPGKGDAVSEGGDKVPNASFEMADGSMLKTDADSLISEVTASIAINTPPAASFAEPKVLKAVIDPKQKPAEGPVPFSFSRPQTMHKEMAEPTKGDAAQQADKKKLTLEQLDREIALDERKDKEHTIDDYMDTGSMFIEGWETALTLISRGISKDSSDSAYEFSKEKRERLIHQATKVSRKKGWVIPVEYLFVGNLIPASAQILIKATDRRKQYNLEKAKAELENREFVPAPAKTTRRGPGRPTK